MNSKTHKDHWINQDPNSISYIKAHLAHLERREAELGGNFNHKLANEVKGRLLEQLDSMIVKVEGEVQA